jgi:phage terminase large subunit-like protein
MSSESGALRGEQRPRSLWVPPYVSSAGEEARELAEVAGLILDPWQAFCLTAALGEREDGSWAAFEVGLEVSRQNGKGGVLEARQLAGLFLLGEELQVHSAHEHKTSLAHQRRLADLVEGSDDLRRELKRVVWAHGEQCIELKDRRRIEFRTRTTSGGRGLSGTPLYLDEAMIIKEAMHGALIPILSAMPNPQIWYTGSAVDQREHEHGVVFARIRKRGLAGEDDRLAWFGWGWHGPRPGAEGEEAKREMLPDEAGELLDDREFWAASNPGMGIRITEEFTELERRTFTARNFAIERLGIGDWPDTSESASGFFGSDAWPAIASREEAIQGVPALAVDVSPDRSSSAIAAAARRDDGLIPVEILAHHRGTGWVTKRLGDLVKKHDATVVVIDGRSPAASLIKDIEEEIGFEVTVMSTAEYAQACGGFFDDVVEKVLRHGDQDELNDAVQGAAVRPLSEAWAWSRKKSTVDITPLVAATLARWGAVSQGEEASVYEERGIVVL